MPRFAANIAYMFTERPALLERVGAAARAGFKAVELQFPYDIPPATMRAEAEKHGVAILGVNTERGDADLFGLTAQTGREREFDAAFDKALAYAVACGGNAVHCLAGKVAPEKRSAAEATYVANLRRAAERAAAHPGIKLLIEPINTIERPDYFLNYVEHAARVLDQVAKPNVKMQFDFYHVQIMQGDLIRRFEMHLPYVGHVQIAGVPLRHEPDIGEVHYPAVFEALDRLGYDGWVSCEYRNRGRAEDGLGWGRDYGLKTGSQPSS